MPLLTLVSADVALNTAAAAEGLPGRQSKCTPMRSVPILEEMRDMVGIYMYYNDHHLPHFHALYAEHEALFAINTLEILRGELSRRPQAFVVE